MIALRVFCVFARQGISATGGFASGIPYDYAPSKLAAGAISALNRRMKTRLALAAATLIALPFVAFSAATSSSKAPSDTQPGAKPAKPLHVSYGQPIKVADYLTPGKTIVFDFYSDFCPPCVRVAPVLEKLHAKRADIVVVKVDINRPGIKGIDWQSPVAKQFGLRSIPHFKVYGPNGKLLAEDSLNSSKAREMVMGWAQ